MSYRVTRRLLQTAPPMLRNNSGSGSTTTTPVSVSGGEVHFQHAGKTGLITLDRQKALNAITRPMVRSITEQLVRWRDDRDVEVVCIEGAGTKAFCAGGDVVSITKDAHDHTDAMSFFRDEFQMNHLIGTYNKVYVALIHGITMGGGVGLSVHGKYRVATDKSLFAMPETAIGYFPDVGGSYFLSRLKHPYGLFLGLTGYRLKGADLKHVGIATHYTTVDQLADLRTAILHSDAGSIESVLAEHEAEMEQEFSLLPHSATIDTCFTASSVPEIVARLHQDNSPFAQKQIATLERMSPRSLVVTHKLLALAGDMSYEDCFRMELNAAHEIVASGEFREGVRALLVDKDNSPVWKPPTVAGVTEDIVQKYFDRNVEPWEPLAI